MNYTLVDGTEIDLNNIYEVSKIKDYGLDTNTIYDSTLSFIIRFKSGKSKKISKNYHYSEWFQVYNELKTIRNDIIENWERIKAL